MIFKHRLFTALLGLLFATVLTDQAYGFAAEIQLGTRMGNAFLLTTRLFPPPTQLVLLL